MDRGLSGRGLLCAALALLAMAATGARVWGQAEPLPERVAVALPKERLAALPGQVVGARVSPEGRVWYQLAAEHGADLDAIEDRIEREWDQGVPQIAGMPAVCFQKTAEGKPAWAWFAGYARGGGHDTRTVAIGFDGKKKWIEHTLETEVITTVSAVQVGDAVLFSSSDQVMVYDPSRAGGDAWAKKDFRDERRSHVVPQVVAEPDGQGAVVVAPLSSGDVTMWRYRGGKWTQLAFSSGKGRLLVVGIAPTAEGVWVLACPAARMYASSPAGQVLRFVRYDQPVAEKTPAGKATVTEPDGLSKDAVGVEKVGDFGMGSPAALVNLSDGRALLHARIADAETGRGRDGWLLMDAGGKWSRFGSPKLELTLGRPSMTNGQPRFQPAALVCNGGRNAWLAGGSSGPLLLDLAKQEVAASFPWLDDAVIHTVLPEGRAVVQSGGCMLMIDPAAPDTRPVLPALPDYAGMMLDYAMADDGRLLVMDAAGKLMSFDGQAWSPALGEKATIKPRDAFIVGKDGAILTRTAGGYALVAKEKTYEAGTLADLVEESAPAVAEAFTGPQRLGTNRMDVARASFYVHGDPAGNVFLLESRNSTPRVWIKDPKDSGKGHWADVRGALRAARAPVENITSLLPVGDGSAAIANSDRSAGSRESSGLLRVERGELQVTTVPHFQADRSFGQWRTLYDHAGGLWAYGLEPVDASAYSTTLMRFTTKGVEDKFPGQSMVFADRDGNVWLREAAGATGLGGLVLWRNGATTAGPDFAGAGVSPLPMASDGPGAIWAVGAAGLVHMSANGSGNSKVEVDKTYQVEGAEGRPTVLEASRLGFLVLVNRPTGASPSARLRVVGLAK